MDDIFRPCIKFVVMYIYDILIFIQTWKYHLSHIEKFYELVCNHGFVLSSNPRKTKIGVLEINFLGFSISFRKIVL